MWAHLLGGVNALLLVFRPRRVFNFVLRIPGSTIDLFKAYVENFSVGQIGASPVFSDFLESI